MPRSHAQAAGIKLASPATSASPNPKDPDWAAWERHLDAGRIGGRIGSRHTLSFESRIRMMQNEIVLFGRVVTRALERF